MTEETEQNRDDEERTAPDGGTSEGAPEETSETVELRKKLDEALRSAESNRDQLLRKAAEFENYKRRTESDYGLMVRNATENVLTSLIPIVEDFARSFRLGKESGNGDPFVKGMEMIYQKLTRVLESLGLVTFESTGKPFDVKYHDALLQIPRSDVPSGTIIEEVERGYLLHDKVLRHAKVIVSSGAHAEDTPASGDNKETTDA